MEKIIKYNWLEGKQLLSGDVISITWLDGTITTETVISEINELNYRKSFIYKYYDGVLAKVFLEENPDLLCERFYE